MAQRKRNSGKIRDLELVAGVVDLTNATADYPLSVNETAKINITAASTNLRIAVADGWYQLVLQFDKSSFSADRAIELRPNGTTYAGAFQRSLAQFSTAVATDEIDVDEATADSVAWGTISPQYIECSITIFGNHRTFRSFIRNTASTTNESNIRIHNWNSATAYTSLGTLEIVEVATGVCYVKRIA